MKMLKLFVVLLMLAGMLSSCATQRSGHYGSRKYRREHMPEPPPGYRGM